MAGASIGRASAGRASTGAASCLASGACTESSPQADTTSASTVMVARLRTISLPSQSAAHIRRWAVQSIQALSAAFARPAPCGGSACYDRAARGSAMSDTNEKGATEKGGAFLQRLKDKAKDVKTSVADKVSEVSEAGQEKLKEVLSDLDAI